MKLVRWLFLLHLLQEIYGQNIHVFSAKPYERSNKTSVSVSTIFLDFNNRSSFIALLQQIQQILLAKFKI
jgi:hypothetical protein